MLSTKSSGDNLSFDASRKLSAEQREVVASEVLNTLFTVDSYGSLPNTEKLSGAYRNPSKRVALNFSLQRQPILEESLAGDLLLYDGDFKRAISREAFLPFWSETRSNSDVVAILGSIDTIKGSGLYDNPSVSDFDMWNLFTKIPTTVKRHSKEFSLEILTPPYSGVDVITRLAAASIYAKAPKSHEFGKKHGHRRREENFSTVKIETIAREDGVTFLEQDSRACINQQTGEVSLVSSVRHMRSGDYRAEADPEELVFQVTEACKLLIKTIPVENDPLALL